MTPDHFFSVPETRRCENLKSIDSVKVGLEKGTGTVFNRGYRISSARHVKKEKCGRVSDRTPALSSSVSVTEVDAAP